jgi:hypothetical protein
VRRPRDGLTSSSARRALELQRGDETQPGREALCSCAIREARLAPCRRSHARNAGFDARKGARELLTNALALGWCDVYESPPQDLPRERGVPRLVDRDAAHDRTNADVTRVHHLPGGNESAERLTSTPLDCVVFEELDERWWGDVAHANAASLAAEALSLSAHHTGVAALVRDSTPRRASETKRGMGAREPPLEVAKRLHRRRFEVRETSEVCPELRASQNTSLHEAARPATSARARDALDDDCCVEDARIEIARGRPEEAVEER